MNNNLKKATKGSNSSSVGNVVRLKILMTQEELRQILSYNDQNKQQDSNYDKYTSIEELLNVMKMRKRRRSRTISKVIRSVCKDNNFDDDDDQFRSSSWRPRLESIPEDH
ncbi:hypothetical protein BVC80_1737g2 [Macleaya cordata]|uniref:Uncharacterized protein n=1 Tax=Macleaya cordata TaxID=56857 RepID=A0A200Q888_MACCD|nr:hypothetical protein BVC80_1737g2 [Macleaya cordata]